MKRSAARTFKRALTVMKLMSNNDDFKGGAEGGTPAHPFPGKPVHRLPVFLIGTAVGIKKGLRQFV
jgi:hypothetical protein